MLKSVRAETGERLAFIGNHMPLFMFHVRQSLPFFQRLCFLTFFKIPENVLVASVLELKMVMIQA